MSNIKPIKIDINDRYRVLLTELLPYEVPLWFSNDFFYEACKNNKHNKESNSGLSKILSDPVKGSFIPLVYTIRKNDDGFRDLAIMHPKAQLDFVDFYNEYDQLILHYCQISNQSLRAPKKIVKKFYENENISLNINGVEEEHKERLYCSSYFIYNQYSFLYEFFESYVFHSLERKFQKFVQFDISKCFNHIYTHSVTWAVKTKDFVKCNMHKQSFDDSFDTLMQNSNYKETNGILVGPEISRIFAEFILQRIDVNIINELEKKENESLKIGIHYDFKRYVDDYFIFYSEEKHFKYIKETIIKCLSEYKLYLNESKTKYLTRPFISDISLCKQDISKIIDSIFENSISEVEIIDSENNKIKQTKVKKIVNISSYANKRIVDIKSSIKRYNVNYKSIAGYINSCLYKQLEKYLSKTKDLIHSSDENITSIGNSLLVYTELVFFVYSMDVRVRTTDWIAQIFSLLINKTNKMKHGFDYLLKKKIFDSSKQILDLFILQKNITHIEIGNLFLMLTLLGDDFLLEEKFIKEIFKPDENILENGGYFMWISIMLYIKNNSKYLDLKNTLCKLQKDKFEKQKYDLNSTELFMFLLDYLSCPYVALPDKIELVQRLKSNGKLQSVGSNDTKDFINSFKNESFFVDWISSEWTSHRIEKKKYRYAYE